MILNNTNKPEEEQRTFEPLSPGTYVFNIIDVKPIRENDKGNSGECITLKVMGEKRRGALIFLNIFTHHNLKWLIKQSDKLLSDLIEHSGKSGITDTASLINSTVTGEVVNKTGIDGRVWANISKFLPTQKETQITFTWCKEDDHDEDIPF